MELVTNSTSIGSGEDKFTYDVKFLKFANQEEYAAALLEKNPDADVDKAITEILNAAQEQGAKQTKKGDVREALKSGDEEKVAEAVKAHQEWAETYVISGATRGRIAGVTKTAAGDVGKALLEADPDQLKALADQLGIEL
jgi:hypothetical protein